MFFQTCIPRLLRNEVSYHESLNFLDENFLVHLLLDILICRKNLEKVFEEHRFEHRGRWKTEYQRTGQVVPYVLEACLQGGSRERILPDTNYCCLFLTHIIDTLA